MSFYPLSPAACPCGAPSRNSIRYRVSAILCFLLLASSIRAATFYVDFETGSNSNSGTSTSAPWKHAPGDPAATGNANRSLSPGDVVLLKGGVQYRGRIHISSSGGPGAPIVYKGNGWGTGKAIIEGSENMSGWRPAVSSAEVEGNTNWAKILITDAVFSPATGSDHAFTANLYQGEQLLLMAQEPDPPDVNYFSDDTSSMFFAPPSNVSSTSLFSSTLPSLGGPSLANGGYFIAWVTGNQTKIKKITGYSSNTITFNSVGSPYNDRNTRWAVSNCLALLDNPGEYVISPPNASGVRRIYLWPLSDVNAQPITRTVRGSGISIGAVSYVTVEGIIVQKVAGDSFGGGTGIGGSNSSPMRNITIKDCDARYGKSLDTGGGIDLRNGQDVTVINCYVHDNVRQRGILMGSITRANVLANTVYHNGGTGIYFGGVSTGTMDQNSVRDNRGIHGNGLTAYQFSSNITISRNVVERSNIALTLEDSSGPFNITNNILSSPGGLAMALWTPVTNVNFYHNLAVGSVHAPNGATGIYRNNIIGGFAPPSGIVRTHNLYIGPLMWSQNSRYGWTPGQGEIIELDHYAVFVAPDVGDYHLVLNSPAINAGTDVGVGFDIEGNSRLAGSAPDIGPYESDGVLSAPRVPAPVITPSGGTFTDSVEVTITVPLAGAEIKYTTDGTDPNYISPLYTGSLTFFQDTVLKARAWRTGYENSPIVSAFFNVVPSPPPPDVSDCDVVTAMSFDELTAGFVQNAVHPAINGAVLGPTWTPDGKFGGGLVFDGQDDWVEVPHDPRLNLTDSMTLMAWVNPDPAIHKWRIVMGKEQPGSLCYYLASDSPGADAGVGGYTSNQWKSVNGGPVLPAGQWSHLAATYDGTTMRVFVNGIEVASKPQPVPWQTSSDPFHVGGTAYINEWFKGKIDEVRVYSCALTGSDIANIMNQPVAGLQLNAAREWTRYQ